MLLELLKELSACKLKDEDILFLIGLFKNKFMGITLLYRGSIHGWMHKDFHDNCDDKGATISLFQIKNGDCIGGFTNAQWSSPYSFEEKKDDTAVVFNLTRHRSFPVNKGKDAITCYKNIGAKFGYWSELSAYNEPFNADRACWSLAKESSYSIPMDSERINQLTNQKENGG